MELQPVGTRNAFEHQDPRGTEEKELASVGNTENVLNVQKNNKLSLIRR